MCDRNSCIRRLPRSTVCGGNLYAEEFVRIFVRRDCGASKECGANVASPGSSLLDDRRLCRRIVLFIRQGIADRDSHPFGLVGSIEAPC